MTPLEEIARIDDALASLDAQLRSEAQKALAALDHAIALETFIRALATYSIRGDAPLSAGGGE
jgi:hypothetical protein